MLKSLQNTNTLPNSHPICPSIPSHMQHGEPHRQVFKTSAFVFFICQFMNMLPHIHKALVFHICWTDCSPKLQSPVIELHKSTRWSRKILCFPKKHCNPPILRLQIAADLVLKAMLVYRLSHSYWRAILLTHCSPVAAWQVAIRKSNSF